MQTLGEAIYVGHHQPGTETWHENRRLRLGGSEVSAVLGLSPWQSHLSLWWQKKGLIPHTDGGSEVAEWGNRLEKVIFDKFIENHDEDWDYQPGSYVHSELDWMLASPDGMRPDDNALLEIKTSQNDFEWGEPPHGEIPIGYRCQILHNMHVMGADHCWLPVLIRGCIYREYLVVRDAEAEADIQIIIEAGQRFIRSLIDDQAPDIDGHNETYKALRARHPEIDDGDTEISRDIADPYIAAVLAEKDAKQAKQLWGGKILDLMRTSRNAVDETGQRIALRKPASNADRIPFLMADPALIRSLRPTPRTIKETQNA